MYGRVPKFDQTDEDSAIEKFVRRREGKKTFVSVERARRNEGSEKTNGIEKIGGATKRECNAIVHSKNEHKNT